MMSGRRDEPAVGGGPSAAAGRKYDWTVGGNVGALAQSVTARLFAASLDLNLALTSLGDGPAAERCATALDELDGAIKQVRQVALAAQERPGDGQRRRAGASPDAPRRLEGGLWRRWVRAAQADPPFVFGQGRA